LVALERKMFVDLKKGGLALGRWCPFEKKKVKAHGCEKTCLVGWDWF
jgi:hypothetical protein